MGGHEDDRPVVCRTALRQYTQSSVPHVRLQVYGLPPDRVFVSVYEDDDDAYALWRDTVGVPETHIHRLGAEDNFWESGPTGAPALWRIWRRRSARCAGQLTASVVAWQHLSAHQGVSTVKSGLPGSRSDA